MTDDHGPTVKALRHPKGRLKMVSREDTAATPASAINDPPEELENLIAGVIGRGYREGDERVGIARRAIAAVRQWDRAQRAKIDEATATAACEAKHGIRAAFAAVRKGCYQVRPTVDRTAPEPSREPSNPDDYTDPFNMVTKGSTGGLTEWKRG